MIAKGKLSAEAKRGIDDLFFFSTYFCGLTLEEEPHREMCNALSWPETHPETPNVILSVPRYTYKTSIVIADIARSFIRNLYLYDDPYLRVMIASSTLPLANTIMKTVGSLWRYGGVNQRLVTEYGPMWANREKDTEGSKSEEGITWAPRLKAGQVISIKEPSLFIGSERRVSTGFHADKAYLDDLNNKDNVKTDHRRKQTQEYYRLIYPILGSVDRNGNPTHITMTCTPWHDDDVCGMVLREEKKRAEENPDDQPTWKAFYHYNKEPFEVEGHCVFPSKYGPKVLEKLRDNMGVREFSAAFLGDPRGTSGFVDEETIQFKGPETFPGDLRHGRISVDPNQHKDAKELGCYAAIVVTAYDRFAKLYVLDAAGSREWDTGKFIDELFRLQDLYHGWPIFMEDSHMSHFAHAVSMEETRRSEKEGKIVRLRVHYTPIDYKTSKYERWQKLHPRFKNRAIIFSDNIPMSIKREIKDELVRGEASRFKDFLDALAMAETGYRPRLDKQGQPIETVHTLPGEAPTNRGVMTFAEVLGDDWTQFQ